RDGIRILAGGGGAGDFQRLQVEDRDGVAAAVADEALVEIRRDRDAVHAGRVGNVADHLVGVQIDHHDVGGVRDVEPPRGAVDREIVPAAIAADRNVAQDVI